MFRIVLLFVVSLTAGCSDHLDRRIKIVLPNDHHGEFTIVKDKNGKGVEVTSDYYVYTVPQTGELRTPDISPFFKWHQERIEYLDGRVLADVQQGITSRQGFTIKDLGTTAGSRRTGPSSSEGSARLDGTTLRWKVVATPEAP
ncbi:MAG: hypothetical protein KGQ51_18860 [Planctomycetes bacterium]|nr:hypothetical protein [Planctomycetota bacterium]